METKAGDPGAFAHFNLHRVPSPAFVVDEAALRRNLSILADVKQRSGAKILCAMKAFSMWKVAPIIGEYLDGVCSSGLWESRLARDYYKGEIATYCAGYKESDMAEIVEISDHVIFNSPHQLRRFVSFLNDSVDVGLRINPEHAEGEVPKYDRWLNFGGGHHITRADYQRDELIAFIQDVRAETGLDVYLEPGEAIALDAGILIGELLDVFENGIQVGITDISATCHMPDVIEAPYRPAMLAERSEGTPVRLGGPSCLAGDIIGDYVLPVPAELGARFAFLDQAHYSMVKTNTFNGVPLPSLWLWNSETDTLECVRTFEWTEFRDRLS